jgi:uncharacterized protein (DUF1697 family)
VATYVALLRGVNLGPSRKLPRPALASTKTLGVRATQRNRRTVTKLLELARA